MERILDVQLDEVKRRILLMGGYVEDALEEATHALKTHDLRALDKVYALEKKINEAHLEVDRLCMHIFAKNAPVAVDLRFVLSVVKINTDLERMGDQAVNIAHTTGHYFEGPPISPLPLIGEMTIAVKEMVKMGLDSFVSGSKSLAQKVLEADDHVDALKDRMFREMVELIKKEPDKVEAALDLILIARNLERLGDHATNIAEDVIFVATGEDIRHGSLRTKNGST